jgi:hypothetical protein
LAGTPIEKRSNIKFVVEQNVADLMVGMYEVKWTESCSWATTACNAGGRTSLTKSTSHFRLLKQLETAGRTHLKDARRRGKGRRSLETAPKGHFYCVDRSSVRTMPIWGNGFQRSKLVIYLRLVSVGDEA